MNILITGGAGGIGSTLCIELAKKEKPAVEDAALNRLAFIFRKGDDPVMVHHCTVSDLTPEDFKKYTRNYRTATLDFFS